jgi:hypothetical protein
MHFPPKASHLSGPAQTCRTPMERSGAGLILLLQMGMVAIHGSSCICSLTIKSWWGSWNVLVNPGAPRSMAGGLLMNTAQSSPSIDARLLKIHQTQIGTPSLRCFTGWLAHNVGNWQQVGEMIASSSSLGQKIDSQIYAFSHVDRLVFPVFSVFWGALWYPQPCVRPKRIPASLVVTVVQQAEKRSK